MVLKKSHFPIFILILLLSFSCEQLHFNKPTYDDKSKYIKTIAIAEKQLELQHFDSAFFYFNKAKISCDINDDHERIIYTLIRMAGIQQILGDFSGSETSATEALDYFNNDVDPDYKVSIYNILGIAYEEQLDFENAISYYNQTLQLTNDELQKAIIKNNIAVVNMDKKQFTKAIALLNPLLQNKTVLQHQETYARILDNLGFCFFKTNHLYGINHLNQSLLLRKKIKDDFGLIASCYHLSDYYEKSNNNFAKQYASLAYETATKIKSPEDRLESLALIIKNSSGIDSKKYAIIHINLNDSLNKVKQSAKNQFAKVRYDAQKEKTENFKLKSQKEKLSISLLVLLGISFFVVLLIRSKNKHEKLKASYDTETRIAKRLHDELANDVFHSLTYAETQDLQQPDKKEFLIEELDKIYSQVRNISKENNSIDTGEAFQNNLLEMLSDFNSENVKVIINNNFIDWKNIASDKKITIHRILLELMVNMKKHSQCSLVVVGFETVNNIIEITYADNGIGDKNSLFLNKGLQNVENRIQAIKGTINFDNNARNGFKIKISFHK